MHHGRSLLLAALACCLCANAPTHAQRVAELGNFEQISFRGLETYTADQLRSAMRLSNDVQFAAHPTAPLDGFRAALESFVRQGYRNGGFSEPAVRAFVEHDGVVLEVDEGPRYRQGDVRIAGGDGLPGETMRQCLLESKPANLPHLVIRSDFLAENTQASDGRQSQSDELPRWVKGEYVRFEHDLEDLWRKRLERLLQDLGRIDTRIQFGIELNTDSRTADLVVTVVDVGRQIRADQVVVQGLKRNSRQQLLEFLGIRQGMALDAATVAGIGNQLYDAARFVSHDVALVRKDGVGEISLVVDVVELPHGPLLNEEFNARQVALLRVGRWLDNWDVNAGYLKCHVESTVLRQAGGKGRLDLIISPRHGLTGSFLADLDQRRLAYAVALTGDRAAIFNAERQRCYVHPPFPLAQVDLSLGLGYTDGELKSRLQVNAQAKSDLKQDVPLSFRLKIAPALAVHRATSADARWVRSPTGLTTVKMKDSTIEFDEGTGQVHRIWESSQQQVVFRLEFSTDKTAAPHEDFSERYIGLSDVYSADYPLASFVGFVVGELLWNARANHEDHDRLSRRTDVLSHLVARQLGPVLESFSSGEAEENREAFPGSHTSSIPFTSDYRVILAAYGPALADRLFPRRSWPWILLREAAFTAQGRSRYTLDEVQYLLKNPDVGPLGCAVLAQAMAYIKAAELSRQFADRGIRRLTRDDLRRDLALFTSGNRSAPQLIAVMVDLFRGFSAEEISAVCELFNDPKLSQQIQGLHNILAFDRRPSNELIVSRVETFWDIALKSQLEKSMRKHLLVDIHRDRPGQP